jgi:excisionase family DNA binding protein
MADTLLTSEQVAKILQVHPFTVLKYIKEGKLKGIKLGRVWRIRESDVERFLEERFMAPSEKSKKESQDQEAKILQEKSEDNIDDDIHSEVSEEPEEPADHYILE